jgi:prefoldin subunit 5
MSEMSDPTHSPHPSVEHLDKKTTRHESEIAELKRGQNALHTSFETLATDVNRKFEKIMDVVQAKTEVKPTNWFAIIFAFCALAGLMFQHVALVLSPERARIDKAESWIDNRRTELKEDYQKFGEVIGSLSVTEKEVREIHTDVEQLQQDQARDDGRMEIIREWLRDVDMHGSRRWVDKKTEP